mmetsp:Transcript_3625/g.5251  ORF Transcript_3625/g.5251 Transcript_3625/m.5251 type:complete len:86 (-) Transcript_3625:787-1044(-)
MCLSIGHKNTPCYPRQPLHSIDNRPLHYNIIAVIAFLNTLCAELITAYVTYVFVAIITIIAITRTTGMHFCTICTVVSFTRVAAT